MKFIITLNMLLMRIVGSWMAEPAWFLQKLFEYVLIKAHLLVSSFFSWLSYVFLSTFQFSLHLFLAIISCLKLFKVQIFQCTTEALCTGCTSSGTITKSTGDRTHPWLTLVFVSNSSETFLI